MWTKSRRIILDLCHSCYWWRGMFFCNSDDVCCNWLLHRTVECLLPNSDIGIMKILKEIQKNFCGMFLCVLRDVFSLRNQSPITSLILPKFHPVLKMFLIFHVGKFRPFGFSQWCLSFISPSVLSFILLFVCLFIPFFLGCINC